MDASAFFARLSELAERDSSVVATLRRSVAFEPGAFAPAFPIIEPYVSGQPEWRRRNVYLVAGLWALGQRRSSGPAVPIAVALRRVGTSKSSSSVELRFTALLDSDNEELPHRLRQAVGLVTSQQLALDWPRLLEDVGGWGAESRYVQRRWARDFWSKSDEGTQPTGPAAQHVLDASV